MCFTFFIFVHNQFMIKFIDVLCLMKNDGTVTPLTIFWEDGRKFRIDKIKDIRRAASLKAGGTGIRYTCLVWGKECYLFYEENYKWFVEEKVAA